MRTTLLCSTLFAALFGGCTAAPLAVDVKEVPVHLTPLTDPGTGEAHVAVPENAVALSLRPAPPLNAYLGFLDAHGAVLFDDLLLVDLSLVQGEAIGIPKGSAKARFLSLCEDEGMDFTVTFLME